jgi:hypothetical protein
MCQLASVDKIHGVREDEPSAGFELVSNCPVRSGRGWSVLTSNEATSKVSVLLILPCTSSRCIWLSNFGKPFLTSSAFNPLSAIPQGPYRPLGLVIVSERERKRSRCDCCRGSREYEYPASSMSWAEVESWSLTFSHGCHGYWSRRTGRSCLTQKRPWSHFFLKKSETTPFWVKRPA